MSGRSANIQTRFDPTEQRVVNKLDRTPCRGENE